MITIKKYIIFIFIYLCFVILILQIKQIYWILETYNKNTKEYEICSMINRKLETYLNNIKDNDKIILKHLSLKIKEKNWKNTRHFLLTDEKWNLYDNSYYLIWKIDLNNYNYQYVNQIWGKKELVQIRYIWNKIYWKNVLDKMLIFYFEYIYSEHFENLYYKILK